MTSDQKIAAVNNLHVKKCLNPLGENVSNTCYKVNRILHNCDMNEDEASDRLYELRSSVSSQGEKLAITIAISLVGRFFSHASQKEGGSNLVIKTLRLFINSCIITPTKDTKYEWCVLLNNNY
ncbi:hypothetical protein RMATCC62417_14691 [Rhizopus microsporus]|nr:hypothetical protein RMATCC62417_14691 [Rhizopus microsporus]